MQEKMLKTKQNIWKMTFRRDSETLSVHYII